MARRRHALLACVLLGVALRFAAASFGSNYDFESYGIVSRIVDHGGNVYALTDRFNYAPLFAWVLGLLRWVAGGNETVFRGLVIALLTAADLTTARILLRLRGPRVAALFFLNPVSILITGFHNQFDTIAIAAGLAAAASLSASDRAPRARALGGLALSLAIKHVFFLLPLWWALRTRDARARLLYLVVPVGLFALTFLPYLPAGEAGIRTNVIEYASRENAPLLSVIAPFASASGLARLLFLVALALGGLAWRNAPPVEQALRYLLVLVCCTPAMANQYLAIAMPAIVVFWNRWFAAYTVLATAIIVASTDGLHSSVLGSRLTEWLASPSGYQAAACLLAIGIAWPLVRERERMRAGVKAPDPSPAR
jgi:hypothetical protein